MYALIGRPPLDGEGSHVMTTEESAPTAVTFDGGSGAKASGVAEEAAEGTLVSPAAFVAVTETL